MTEITNEQILEAVKQNCEATQEMKALLLQMRTRVMSQTTVEKVHEIIKLCKEKGELNTQDVIDTFRVSPRVAIVYMREATKDREVIFYKGHAANPSKLMVVTEENKLDVIAYSVIEDIKLHGRGCVKRISSIVNQHKLGEAELQTVIQKIVNFSGQKIVVTNLEESKPLIHRRLLYKGGL